MLADIHTGSVLRLEWGRFSFVITPALDTAGETVMINDGLALPSTALLPADSGSTQSTGAAWLAALNPRLAPISVGAGNPDDNPAPVVLSRMAGRHVPRTVHHETITVETDGTKLWVTVGR